MRQGSPDLNLVTVSSIKPPKCKILGISEGRKYLLSGQITFAVMARSSTKEPNRLIAASIGLADPKKMINTDIYQNITQQGKQHRKLEIMLKIWQWKCWLQPWDYQTIHL